MDDRLKILAIKLGFLAGVLALWELAARSAWIDAFWTSSPILIIQSFWQSLLDNEITYHTAVTMQEALAGLAVGAAVGILLGLALSFNRLLGAAFEPFVIALNSLPRVALAPLIVMFVGIGFASKFLLAFSLVVVPVMINTYEGVKATDPQLVNMMRVMGARRRQVFLKVLLPNCIPWIFSALRVSISFAIIGAIVGEFISSRAGIGFMIDSAAGAYDTTGMIMPLFVLMILAFTLDRIFVRICDRLLHWRMEAQ